MANRPKIVINDSRNGQGFIKLVAANGKTLAHSETYKTTQGLENAIKAMKQTAQTARVVDNRKE